MENIRFEEEWKQNKTTKTKTKVQDYCKVTELSRGIKIQYCHSTFIRGVQIFLVFGGFALSPNLSAQ